MHNQTYLLRTYGRPIFGPPWKKDCNSLKGLNATSVINSVLHWRDNFSSPPPNHHHPYKWFHSSPPDMFKTFSSFFSPRLQRDPWDWQSEKRSFCECAHTNGLEAFQACTSGQSRKKSMINSKLDAKIVWKKGRKKKVTNWAISVG